MQKPRSTCQFVAFGAGVALIVVLPLIAMIPWWLTGTHSFEREYRGVFFTLSVLIPIGFSYAAARWSGKYDKVALITPAVPALTYFLIGYFGDIEIPIQAAATHTMIHSLGSASPFDVVSQLEKMAIPTIWTLVIGGAAIGLNRLVNRLTKKEVGEIEEAVSIDKGFSFRIFCIYLAGAILLGLLIYPFYVRLQYTPEARCKRASKELFSPSVSLNRKVQLLSDLSRIPGDRSTEVLRRVFEQQPQPLNVVAAACLAGRNVLVGFPLVVSELLDPVWEKRFQSEYMRSLMLRSIEQITNPAAVPMLSHLMKSSDSTVRNSAMQALRNTDSELVIDTLLSGLEDLDQKVRWMAAMGLAEIVYRSKHTSSRNPVYLLYRQWMPNGEADFLQNEKSYIDHWREWAQTDRKTFKFLSKAELEAESVYIPPPKPTTYQIDRFNGQEAVLKFLDKNGTLIVPTSIDALPVVSIGDNTFYESGLKKLILSEGILRLGNSAFARCPDLTNVVIPCSVIFVGKNAFYGCKSLQSIDVDPENPIYRSIDGILFNKRGTVILRYPPAKPDTLYAISDTVRTIAASSFAFSKKLTDVIIPKGVTYIGAEAFAHCWNVTNIIVPESVTTICSGAFEDCSHLPNIQIPSSVTNMENTPFDWCHKLVSLSVDSNSQSYTVIDQVLFNKQGTRLIKYLPSKTNSQYTIPSSVTSLGPNSFSLCKNLKWLTIPEGVTNIGAGAFSNSSAITNLSIPLHLHRIEAAVFWNCGLVSVTIPSEVTSIGEDAFSSCKQLTDVSIPASVTNIESGAFRFCKSLTNASFLGDAPTMGQQVFRGAASNFTVQYHEGASAWARPVERVLTQEERIFIPSLGISIMLPAKTQVIGPGSSEATNYVFPWFQTPYGEIELAFDLRHPSGSLEDRVEASRHGMSQSKIKILHIDEPSEAGGLTLLRADCEGTNGFKIVRYYFLTPNGKLAFIHLPRSKDSTSLQSIIAKSIRKT